MTSNRSDSATEQIIATEQILKGKLTNHGVPNLHESHKGIAVNFKMTLFILTREETLRKANQNTPNNNIVAKRGALREIKRHNQCEGQYSLNPNKKKATRIPKTRKARKPKKREERIPMSHPRPPLKPLAN